MVDCWNRSAAAFIEEATPATPATATVSHKLWSWSAKVGSQSAMESGNVERKRESKRGDAVAVAAAEGAGDEAHRRIERLVNYMRFHMP